MRGSNEAADANPDAGLREELQSMEAKVRKMRDTRNGFNDNAKAAAEKRNSVQAQYKEHREKLDMSLAEVKAARAEVRLYKEKRNAIQDQVRQLINQAKGRRDEKGEKRSATAEYNQLKSEVSNLEKTYETSSVGPKKEKEIMEKLKRMHRRIEELKPEVAQFEMVSVDLNDLDGSIKTLRAEADAAHNQMLEAVKVADELSKDLDEAFAHRDFLKAEGDRWHNEYLAHREKANEIHEKINELMVDVNKVRDQLNLAREERKSWITDHNDSVKAEMKTGAESEEVANALVDSLLNQGNLTFGGIGAGDRSGLSVGKKSGKSNKKKSMRRVDMNASRRR